MSSVGWATLSVIPSVRGIQQSVLNQINGPMRGAGAEAGQQFGSSFSQRASSIISKVGGAATSALKTGFTAATIGAGTATAALTTFGLKGSASLETTTTAFTSLLGSSAAAQTQIAGLEKFAAATPFSQQDVLGYAQQFYSLAGSIGMSKDQVQPFLTDIGDLGSVTGASTENIKNAVQAIGQIGSTGKVSLDNLNQISQAFPGFNGAAAIASATGKTTAQVMTEISAGTLDASTGVQALLTGMKTFPGAAGAMSKQSETLVGLWSTFKDTAQITLTSAFTPMIPIIKSTMSQVTPVIGTALSSVAPAIAGLVSAVAPMITPLVGSLGGALTSILKAVTPAIQAMMPAVKILVDGLAKFAQAIAPAFSALAPVFKPLATALVQIGLAVAPIIVEFAKLIGTVGPPLMKAITAIVKAIAPVVTVLLHALAPILPVIAKAFTSLVVALAPLIKALSGAFVIAIAAIVPVLAKIVTAVAPVVSALVSALAPVLPVIANAFTSILTALSPLIPVLSGALSTVIAALAPVLPVLAGALGHLAVAFAKILVALSPLIPVIVQLVAKLFTDVIVNLIIQVANAFTAILTAILPLLPPLVSLITTILPPLIGFFSSIVSTLIGFVVPAIKLFGDIVLGVFQAIVAGADDAFGWIPGIGGGLHSARKAMDGFKNNWDDSFDKMKSNSSLTVDVNTTTANSKLDGLAGRLADGTIRPGDVSNLPGAGVPDYAAVAASMKQKTSDAAAAKAKTASDAAAAKAKQASDAAAAHAKQVADALAAKIKAALPALKTAGGDLIKSIQDGIASKSLDPKAMTDAFKSFMAAVKTARDAGVSVSRSAVSAIAGENAHLERMAASMQGVIAKLATARDKVTSIRDSIKSLTASVHDAVTGSFDITTAGQGTDAFGQPKQVTATSVMADIKAKVAAAKNFDAELGVLRKKGLSPDLIAELAQAGPSAEPEARVLAAMSAKTLGQITGQYKLLSKYGTEAGTTAAGSMYQTGLSAAQGIVAGLKSQEGALETQMKHLGSVMAGAIRDALGIHSPSSVAFDISANFVKSLANSADAHKYHLIESMQSISDTMSIDPQGGALGQLLMGGGLGASAAAPVTQNFHHVASDPRVLAQEASRRLAMLRR